MLTRISITNRHFRCRCHRRTFILSARCLKRNAPGTGGFVFSRDKLNPWPTARCVSTSCAASNPRFTRAASNSLESAGSGNAAKRNPHLAIVFREVGTFLGLVPACRKPSSTRAPSTRHAPRPLNVDMGRCVWCHGVVTRNDDHCYVCGDSVPKHVKFVAHKGPAHTLMNVIFVSVLAFSVYCFLSDRKLYMLISFGLACTLLLARIVMERLANRNQD